MMDQRRGLGRGLAALMGEVKGDTKGDAPRRPDMKVPVEMLKPNPDQPRRSFPEAALEELAASIREKGVIQPLIVREKPKGSGTYEIIAGERRWRAAQLARLHELPVIIRDFNDTEVLEVAIIENIQRDDLNAVEEAQAYAQLMERFGHTQEKVAATLGKSRSHIANFLRMLSLPEEVLSLVRDGKLSAGHARALVVLDDPGPLARRAVAEGLSVRGIEALAKAENAPPQKKKPRSEGGGKDADTRALEGEISAALGMKVTIEHQGGDKGGTLSISFKSLEELDDLCAKLGTGS
jgi:ParB family chromosome partitioning protein